MNISNRKLTIIAVAAFAATAGAAMAILFPSHGSDQTHHGLDFIPIAAALVAIFAARKHRAAGTERSTNGR